MFGIADPSRIVVMYTGPDGIVKMKMPPGVEAEDPLIEPKIAVSEACCCCGKYFKADDLKYCSACNTGGPYCGKACQVKDWKTGGHKQQCKPSKEPKTSASSVERASVILLEQLFAYADAKLVDRYEMGKMSISDIARVAFQHAGPGVLMLPIDSGWEVERCILDFQIAVAGNLHLDPGFEGIHLPEMEYMEIPFNPFKHVDFQFRLKALDIGSIMENLTMSQYLLGITVGSTLHLLTFEQNTAGIPKSKKLISAVSRADSLKKRIETDPAFERCRQFMNNLNTQPGVVWIRNLFDTDRGEFDRSELDKVTPELLLKDLIQYQVEVARQVSAHTCACFYIAENGNQVGAKQCFHGEVPSWWESFLDQHLEDILDPHTIVGFFDTALFSNSQMSSKKVFVFKPFG
mmetsp:Transcript_40660/g.98244  ORF Transcript_40660/g.98244 Transcript_40660/m.98244 type:complete len:404 (+) Transcript_40660:71-1282(+)